MGVRSSAGERGCRVAVQVHAERSGTGCWRGSCLLAGGAGFRAAAGRGGMSLDSAPKSNIKRIPRGAAATAGAVNELEVGRLPDGLGAPEQAACTRLRPPPGSSLSACWHATLAPFGVVWTAAGQHVGRSRVRRRGGTPSTAFDKVVIECACIGDGAIPRFGLTSRV